MQTDMTVGKPMKMILDFTIPVFIGNVFQQFYNMADAIIVGKFVGTKGLAAVFFSSSILSFNAFNSSVILSGSRLSTDSAFVSADVTNSSDED